MRRLQRIRDAGGLVDGSSRDVEACRRALCETRRASEPWVLENMMRTLESAGDNEPRSI